MSFPSLIDLRSDTVTRPTKGMLDAMFSAEVGDDVFDEDPTVNALEEKAAHLFGKEDALFVPSGTMANQISVKVLTQPQDEVICDRQSHIFYYEAGGIPFNSGVSLRLLDGDRGRIDAAQVADNINSPEFIYSPRTSLVSLENTSNKGGGSYYDIKRIREIAAVCKQHHLKMHLDGARIFNALTETKESPIAIAEYFDTVSFCLSKGLGAPVGSMIVSTKQNIQYAKRIRKAFGGGMRQAGYLAAAGIYALDNNINRLKEDHKRARILADTLTSLSWVDEVLPAETNIVVFRVKQSEEPVKILSYLENHKIKAVPFGKQNIRMVTHLGFSDEMLSETIKVLKTFK